MTNGKILPNPLKFALAVDGISQTSGPNKKPPVPQPQFIRRNPVLEKFPKDPTDPAYITLVNFFTKYHAQLNFALQQPSYSVPEGFPGTPWDTFLHVVTADNANNQYPTTTSTDPRTNAMLNFDGLLEQVHDNFHG